MNNQQISEFFTRSVTSFNEPLPLDYRDRAVDLAIYFNETIEDAKEAENAIESVRWAMVLAYKAKFKLSLTALGKVEGEVFDSNTSPEEVRSDSERTSPR